MCLAIERLNPAPDYLLVDAITVDLPTSQKALIHGDALSQCIAAASILAKVERDACMCEWDKVFPQYGLKNHKGYSTSEHWKALEIMGRRRCIVLVFGPSANTRRIPCGPAIRGNPSYFLRKNFHPIGPSQRTRRVVSLVILLQTLSLLKKWLHDV